MYLPWGSVSSFKCSACGTCCSHFAIPLRFNEGLAIARLLGWQHIEVRKGRFFVRKEGRGCPFLVSLGPFGVCYLQGIGLKPRACKIWPFYVLKDPEYGKVEEAAFSSKYGTFYVYVDTRCPGIVIGRPSDALVEAVREALEIWLGLRIEQSLTTSPLVATVKHTQRGASLPETAVGTEAPYRKSLLRDFGSLRRGVR